MSDYFKKRQEMKLYGKVAEPKKAYSIPKKSAKKIKQEAEEKEKRGDNFCEETGLRTETKIYQYAIMSICHILPKRLCKSVAYHPQNWIELAPDIHAKFDSISWDEKETWGCWPKVRDRLITVWQELDKSERRHFPSSVIEYMKANDNFAIEGEYDV
jgi:hypothetical protein